MLTMAAATSIPGEWRCGATASPNLLRNKNSRTMAAMEATPDMSSPLLPAKNRVSAASRHAIAANRTKFAPSVPEDWLTCGMGKSRFGPFLPANFFSSGLIMSSDEQVLTAHWASLAPVNSTSGLPLHEMVINGKKKASSANMARVLFIAGINCSLKENLVFGVPVKLPLEGNSSQGSNRRFSGQTSAAEGDR